MKILYCISLKILSNIGNFSNIIDINDKLLLTCYYYRVGTKTMSFLLNLRVKSTNMWRVVSKILLRSR